MRCGAPGGAHAMAAARYPDRGCTSPCAKVQNSFECDLLPSYVLGFGEFSAFLEFYLTI